MSTEVEAKVKAKADEVKAIRSTQTKYKMEIGKRLDKKLELDLPATLPLHFATTFNISVSICIGIIFTILILIFNIFISSFNPFLSDLVDHHSQTFTLGNLRVCEMLFSSQKTALSQAETAVTASATPDYI
jgi:hypothetical protein